MWQKLWDCVWNSLECPSCFPEQDCFQFGFGLQMVASLQLIINITSTMRCIAHIYLNCFGNLGVFAHLIEANSLGQHYRDCADCSNHDQPLTEALVWSLAGKETGAWNLRSCPRRLGCLFFHHNAEDRIAQRWQMLGTFEEATRKRSMH